MCPRCGAPGLFAGWIAFAPACRQCGLDFSRFNVGDGPAAFLIFLIGALVVGLALWLELALAPPWWVHALLWLPLIMGGALAGLRLAKGWLLVTEWRRAAGEHRQP